MKKLSILMVAGWIYPDSAGGSQRVIYEIGKRLRRKGHTVSIVTGRETNGKLPEREKIAGMEIRRYSVRRFSRWTFYFDSVLRCNLTVRHLLGARNFNAVIFHHPLASLGAILALKSRKTRRVYLFHGSSFLEYLQKIKGESAELSPLAKCLKLLEAQIVSRVIRFIEKSVIKRCDKIIAFSKYNVNILRALYRIDSLKIEKLTPGVDTSKFYPSGRKESVRRKLSLPEDKKILLSIRRLDYRMGLENLLGAVAKLPDEHNFLLLIGGEGVLLRRLQRLTHDLGIKEKVRFLGHISEEKLHLYYQACDLFILPSECLEGFGMVTLEALSSGLPTLGTTAGATPEILSGLSKELLFKGRDPESIACLIDKSLRDFSEFDNFAQKSRAYVIKNYSWDIFVNKLEETILPKVKVLHIITALNIGGAERILHDICLNLSKDTYENVVCFLESGGFFAEKLKEKGLKVLDLRMRSRFDAAVILRLLRIVSNEAIDLIHTNLSRADIIGYLVALLTRVPIVSTRHNSYEVWDKRRFLAWFYGLVLNHMNRVIAVSISAKDYAIAAFRVRKANITVIPNGVDLNKFQPAVTADTDFKKGSASGEPFKLVGTVGRLEKFKGQDDFLSAAYIISKKREDVKFMIVGDGGARKKLLRRASELGLAERVIFTGWREDIPELLSAMDVFVQPSRSEGFGLSTLEAMACGRAVIAASVDGQAEFLKDRKTALLVEPGAPEQIARETLFLLDNSEKASAIADAAYNEVRKKFSITRTVKGVSELYAEVLAGKCLISFL